jgi:hypothetical protein
LRTATNISAQAAGQVTGPDVDLLLPLKNDANSCMTKV